MLQPLHMPQTRESSNRRRRNEGKKKLLTTPFFQTLFMSFGYQSIVHSFMLAVQRKPATEAGDARMSSWEKAPWERGETKKNKPNQNKRKQQNNLDVLSLVCISPFIFLSVVTEAIEEGRGAARECEECPSSLSEFSSTPASLVARLQKQTSREGRGTDGTAVGGEGG